MAADPKTTEDQRAARLQENRNQENQQAEAAEPEAGTQPQQPRYINGAEAIFLVIFAAAGDLAIFIANATFPLLGSAVGGMVWLTFYLWLKFKQIKGAPKSWSRLLTMMGFLEIIPVINILPFWTGFAILIIIADRIGKVPFFENLLQFPRLTRL